MAGVNIYLLVYLLLQLVLMETTTVTVTPTQGTATVTTSSTTSPTPPSLPSSPVTISLSPSFYLVTTSSTTSPTPPSLPASAAASLNKIPGGLQSALLPLLIGGGSLDMNSVTQLMTSLAPQLPALLKGVLQTNTSGLAGSGKVCSEDMDTFLNATMTSKMWAISMLDASGKPGTAMMRGATKFYGNFDECLESVSDVSPVTGRAVRGDTCVVSMTPPPQLMALQGNLPVTAAPSSVSFEWHMCVPNTCKGQHIQAGLTNVLSQLNMSIKHVSCHSEQKAGPVGDDSAAVCAIVLITILGFLVLLGTLLDMKLRVDKGRKDKEQTTPQLTTATLHEAPTKMNNGDIASPDKPPADGKVDLVDSCKSNGHLDRGGNVYLSGMKTLDVGLPDRKDVVVTADMKLAPAKTTEKVPLWQKLLLCFSAVSNGEKIFSVKDTPGSLTCLNGIRVLSMGWVILGHTFSFLLQVADYPVNASDMKENFLFQVILNGTLSVDSFFVLSGLLVTYLFLRETEKKGGVTVKQMVLYYVHRYWRLTPAYAFMIFLNTCLIRYLADGPMWLGPFDRIFCEKNWWINILYLNNVIREKEQCYGVSWYLANDMQFYVVAPMALIPLAFGMRHKFGVYLKFVGLCVVAGFVITSIATTAYFVHDINSDILGTSGDYLYKVYFKPWCRVGTFAIGMALGYILHTTKSKVTMSTFLQGMGWFLALVATGAITLSTYDKNGPGRSTWGVGATTAHETFFRPVWGLVLGWVILMCCSGKAGIIDWMLSWAWWQPLARLTYGAFLLHPVIMFSDMSAATSLVHYVTPNLVTIFFGYTCLSYICAFMLAILVEAPMLQLEKIVLSR